jgi:UDP-2,3-diacylglucosamine pyrophosphatase LpxH
MPYWSLSQYLKYKVKTAVSYVTSFEQAVAMEARRRGLDGVICGHIHHAEMRDIDGIVYCNDGDWVESLTALVEHIDGRMELIHWPQFQRETDSYYQIATADTSSDGVPATAKIEKKDEVPA